MLELKFNEPILERWVTGALFVPDELFVSVVTQPDLVFRQLQESKGALGFVLTEEVDPHRGVAKVQWKAHAAEPGGIDLLRSNYEAAGLRLVITEAQNVVFVGVSKNDQGFASVNNKRDYVSGIIQAAMKTETRDHHWEFQLPADLEQSWRQRLISNKAAPAVKDLQSRHDRADILLLNDMVYLVFYKKIDQLEDFLPDDQWFTHEARTVLKGLQRKQ